MASNSSAVVPYSERTHLALQTGAEEAKLSFTQYCSIFAITAIPFFVLFFASSLFIPLVGKPFFLIMLTASFQLGYFLDSRAEAWLVQKKLEEVCRPLLEENVDDYLRADQIETALERLARPGPGLLMTSEQYLEGEWTPLCFEPKFRPGVRDRLRQYFNEENCPIDCIFGIDGHIFLDHCALIFAKNAENKSLCIVAPLPSATEALFERTKNGLAEGVDYGTHVSVAIKNFSLPSEIIEHISTSKCLDTLRDACQKPPAQRPKFKIKGIMAKETVAVATAMSIDGKETTLFPSGFLEELHQTVGELELEETESTAD